MNYSEILAGLRKKKALTQFEVAEFISSNSKKKYSHKNISHWENGYALPPIEQFLMLCELYDVQDIQRTFRDSGFHGMKKLNALGKSRVEEYIAMLSGNPLFTETDDDFVEMTRRRYIKLYDIPVAAGTGSFLDSDSYEDFEVDDTVPKDTDYAVKIAGDSMMPRFIDRQVVFIKEQQVLEIGDIGIFVVDGDAYIKKLGQGELISLNPKYEPIKIQEYSSFYTLGKVVG